MKIQVFALDNINTSKQEVLICYTDPFDTFNKRQANLKSHYNFDCKCVRCESTDRHKDNQLCRRFNHCANELIKLSDSVGHEKRQFNLIMEQLDICKNILGNYSSRGTRLLCSALEVLIENYKDLKATVKKNDVKKLINTFKDCSQVTHSITYCNQLSNLCEQLMQIV